MCACILTRTWWMINKYPNSVISLIWKHKKKYKKRLHWSLSWVLQFRDTSRINLERVKPKGKILCEVLHQQLPSMKWLLIFFPRYLYWIDCCEYPHIGRVGMDGTNQSVVIETKISRPMALTIDYVNHRLYWADENHIEFSNMDGSHRHKGWSSL